MIKLRQYQSIEYLKKSKQSIGKRTKLNIHMHQKFN